MKRWILAVGLALAALLPSAVLAQGPGSFAGNFSSVSIIPTLTCAGTDAQLACSNGGQGFLSATIKMPNGKSIPIGGRLETSLLTSTLGTGGQGKGRGQAAATGTVVVRPEVKNADGQSFPVFPPQVTFNSRTQVLSAALSGCLTNIDPTTGLPVITCTTPESISLLLSTTSANSFQFVAPNVPQGVYTVKLKIGATADATSTSVRFNSQVSVGVGVGSLTAQIVQVQTPFNSLCFDLASGTVC